MSGIDDDVVITNIDAQREVMIAVATGKTMIQDVNEEYKVRRTGILRALHQRSLEDPNPFTDLWMWYGYWKENLPTYQLRREYVANLYDPLIEKLQIGPSDFGIEIFKGLTGWERVDRGLASIKQRLSTASTEEDFQTVGLLSRETLISLAQVVFDPDIHETRDGTKPSPTDAKRMLDAYISSKLAGGPNEESRRHAKAALDLANSLQHKRTAVFTDAALCAEATNSVVNIVAIISGKRSSSVDV